MKLSALLQAVFNRLCASRSSQTKASMNFMAICHDCGGGGRRGDYCDLPVWRVLVSAGLGRLMDSGGGSGGAASSGGEFQTARRGFVLIFVFI